MKQCAPPRSTDRIRPRQGSSSDDRFRDGLVERYRPLAYRLARRFTHGVDEDVRQVALLGLLKAIDRFDPGAGCKFATFAIPTILGELKRYLRDHSRLLRPSRGLHDLRSAVLAKDIELTAQLGRAPTLAQVAEALGAELEQVAEAMEVDEVCRPFTLDGMLLLRGCEQPVALAECVGAADPELTRAETRIACSQKLNSLESPFREVIRLRYFQNLSQREVGQRLGFSQMHVSRLERRALQQLRDEWVAGSP